MFGRRLCVCVSVCVVSLLVFSETRRFSRLAEG
jgi:hypothetical protein